MRHLHHLLSTLGSHYPERMITEDDSPFFAYDSSHFSDLVHLKDGTQHRLANKLIGNLKTLGPLLSYR